MIHRNYFFDSVRQSLFDGHMTQDQVDGMTMILDVADDTDVDDRHLAYMLATDYHETDRTMQPIEEYGKGEGDSYGVPDPETGQTYYGRGLVQLTWKDNYQRQDTKLGLDGTLVADAARALEPEIATLVMFGGMADGDFTGKSLSDFINYDLTDWVGARRIINGTDCAEQIAGYAVLFCNAITHMPSPDSPGYYADAGDSNDAG